MRACVRACVRARARARERKTEGLTKGQTGKCHIQQHAVLHNSDTVLQNHIANIAEKDHQIWDWSQILDFEIVLSVCSYLIRTSRAIY